MSEIPNDDEICETQKINKAASLISFYNEATDYYLNKSHYINYIVYHQNIRSIHANFNSFISTINSDLSKIDVLIFTEINCNAKDLPKYKLPGFSEISKPREIGRGGGIIIYYRSSFNIKVQDTSFLSAETLQIKINNELLILAIYRPPSKSKSEFLQQLNNHLALLEKTEQKDILILGDININLLDKEDIQVENYQNKMSENGYESCIFSPTREEFRQDSFKSSLLDHVFHKFRKFQNLSSVINYKITDHYSTCTLLFSSTNLKSEPFKDKINYTEVYKMLNKIDWLSIDVSDAKNPVSQIAKAIHETKCANVERVHKYTPTHERVSKEWISDKIEHLLKLRDSYFLRCKRNKTNSNYRSEYNKIRNLANFEIKKAKNAFYRHQLTECHGDSSGTWKILNEILGRSSNSIDENIIRYMPQTLTMQDILHSFGEQFSTKVNDLRHICDFTAMRGRAPDAAVPHSLSLPPANDVAIEYIIEKLKKRKGPGHDKIEVNDVKNASATLRKLIVKIINESIQTGIYPTSLKQAIVRPIYKGGAHKNPANYRPIAILSVIDKIFERYIDINLSNYLNKYEIIDSRQFAYQKGKGVDNLFADLSDYVNTNLSKKEHTLALFLDMSKAFDVLDHDLLLKKLEHIGIRGSLLSLFSTYLKDRSFSIKVDGKHSKFYKAESGVPQGSILGPKLFLIYLNDLLKHLKGVKILIFADDILILCSSSDLKNCVEILQSQFDILCEWAHDNKLIINTKKTLAMHFCSKQMHAQFLHKLQL